MSGPTTPDVASGSQPSDAPAPAQDDTGIADLNAAAGQNGDAVLPAASFASIALPADVVRALGRPRRRVRLPRPPLHRFRLPAVRLLLWTPPVLVLAVALWSAIAGFGSLVQLFRLAISLDFARAATQFPSLDAAGRVLLASLGYFAVLFALRPLAGGLFGRGWARLRLVPGLLLAIPCAWLFVAGAELAYGVPPLASVPAELWRVLVILLLLHGIAVAVVGAQDPATSPVARVTSGPRLSERPARRPEVEEPEMPAHGTDHWPIVRFGPPADDRTLPPDMSDTQALRVAGLLHLLSSESASSDDPRRQFDQSDARADTQGDIPADIPARIPTDGATE